MRDDVFCVILAGGVGTRLWPLSRTRLPKQFLDIMGVGRTMLQLTYDRYSKICKPENFIVVSLDEYRGLVTEQLPQVPAQNVLYEPFRRNTGASVAFAAAFLRQVNPDAIMIVTPSDHMILDSSVFVSCVERTVEYVSGSDELAAVGIKAFRPDTAFGYIQVGDPIGGQDNRIHKVRTFTEKPEADMAKLFFECGDFCWNSGVCVWKVSSISSALAQYMPNLSAQFAELDNIPFSHWDRQVVGHVYQDCENTSISYGVMEKARNVVVALTDASWCDLGGWEAVYDQGEKDEAGNASPSGTVIIKESNGCLVHVEDGTVCVVDGLKDFMVVQKGNVIMVAPRSKASNSWRYIPEVKAEVE